MSHKNNVVVSLHRAGGESFVIGAGTPKDMTVLLEGSMGLDLAPVSHDTSPALAGHGSVYHGSRFNERRIFLPILVEGPTPQDFAFLKDKLKRVTNLLDTRELTLRISVPGRDKYREIPVRYDKGLQGDYTGNTFQSWEVIKLELHSTEAFWRGEKEHIEKSVTKATKTFLEPLIPMRLSDSTVDGQMTLHIAGDLETYPVWTIVGPGEGFSLTHVNTGATFTLTGTIGFGEMITIDMNETKSTIKSSLNPNTNLWGRVTPESEMFMLNPGPNVIDFLMGSATSDSKIHITYNPMFLGGHS